jgi:hypothetical protein
LVEYQISLVDLAYATGTVLGAARIHWEPIVPPPTRAETGRIPAKVREPA